MVSETTTMKQIRNNMLAVTGILCLLAVTLPGCYETHYYHRNHHHTRGWYDRHHQPPPSGVDFSIDIHN